MIRRKVQRMRGGNRHGWGKHHRGAGGRGGRGNAGRGKRGDHKKPSFRTRTLGSYGFAGRSKGHVTISFKEIEDALSQWVADGLVQEKDGIPHIDLKKLGFTKLLGTGKITKKFSLSVDHASKKAVEKIKTAGGTSR